MLLSFGRRQSDSFEFSHNVVLGTAQLRAGSAILTQDNGNQALYIDTSSSWTSGVLNAPGLVWREANNDVIAGIRGYIDANGNNNLALGVGWLDTELIVTSVGVTLPNTLTTGVVTVKGGSADWNETTPGHGKGSIHLDPESNADNFGSAITWGASDSNNGETAQAGIYIRSDGNYGTAMYLSTTDSYSSGSKTAVLIDSAGNTRIQRGNFYVSTGSAVISGALNADSLILNDNNFATEKSYSGTGIFSQSGDWYTLFTINENNTPAYCTLKWEAHSTTTFVVTTGYHGSNVASLNVLSNTWTPNGGYPQASELRVFKDSKRNLLRPNEAYLYNNQPHQLWFTCKSLGRYSKIFNACALFLVISLLRNGNINHSRLYK